MHINLGAGVPGTGDEAFRITNQHLPVLGTPTLVFANLPQLDMHPRTRAISLHLSHLYYNGFWIERQYSEWHGAPLVQPVQR